MLPFMEIKWSSPYAGQTIDFLSYGCTYLHAQYHKQFKELCILKHITLGCEDQESNRSTHLGFKIGRKSHSSRQNLVRDEISECDKKGVALFYATRIIFGVGYSALSKFESIEMAWVRRTWFSTAKATTQYALHTLHRLVVTPKRSSRDFITMGFKNCFFTSWNLKEGGGGWRLKSSHFFPSGKPLTR